ncbi:tRNA(Ile)-lysidine synthase [Breznakibacter xylanolyticus]|uniref:tRNA(Ile)-lysidine synthase n=1 Tax=Breznakibacter xylanolyticus TaxID=990 RepID=A0A2W7MV24_9BACT|nr:tRNA lysidine(34) synthetase TilS [Breznakibacter xylanolyticus]PZX11393.1 tRNA(Ile)-lysidine synthase [Breznakibacter xylanolyticus]
MLTTATFRHTIANACGLMPHQRVLVTVSGGADSMALLHLLVAVQQPVVVAHCNFHLRDDESDGDQAFVTLYCQTHELPFHVRHFNTRDFAAQKGISIEMAARVLRYEWFDQLASETGCSHIATAHHANDNVETFLLNLTRGTGIRGLSGMAMCTGKLIRPLLHFSRIDIETYCRENHLTWRHDSSNDCCDHTRNHIRHRIVPEFCHINPSFLATMHNTMARMQELEAMLGQQVEAFRNESVADEEGIQIIPLSRLSNHPQKGLILFELLRHKNFNATHVADIIASLKGLPGKQFLSPTHRVIRDRHNLVVTPRHEASETETFTIAGDITQTENPLRLHLRTFERPADFRFSTDANCIHLDADRVDFPLTLRHWRMGDAFMPLGMSNFKKLSDFFTDEKMSLLEKENAWLLLSSDNIVWVVGRRVDNRYRITNTTKWILEISLGEKNPQGF